jgi:drug/metabolite transporter (DMT)-like permease
MPKEKPGELLAHGMLLMAAFIAVRVFSVPTYKYLVGSMHPFALDIYYAAAGTIFFGFLTGWKLDWLFRMKKPLLRRFLIFTGLTIIGSLSFDISFMFVNVKTFVILASAMPVVVGFYSAWLLKEKPGIGLWIAAVLAAVGSIVFKGAELQAFGPGELAILGGVLLFSLTPIMSRQYVGIVGRKNLSWWSYASCILPILALNIVLGTFALPPANMTYLAIMMAAIFLFGMPTVFLSIAALKHLPAPTFITITTALMPIGQVLVAMTFLGETLAGNEILGGAIMIAAALLAARATSATGVRRPS